VAPNRSQIFRAYIFSGVAVLVAALGSLMWAETASVKVSVVPQKLVATATLSASQTGGDLKTQHIDATVTQAQEGPASIVLVAPRYAVGEVVFSCASACPTTLTVPSGTLLATDKLLGYATQADAVVTPTRPAKAAVRATAPGASWNTARNTLTVINNSSQYPNGLHVTNPATIEGGSDASSAHMIQQSDWDTLRSAIETKVGDALDLALKAKAVQMSYIANGPPALIVTSDHKVGDMVPSFTITMTGTVGATAFSDTDAQALIRAALDAKVPAGQQLTSDPVEITWQIQQTSPNGDLTVTGTALGFITPKLSTNALRTRIRGLSPADASKSLQRDLPGSTVEIRISPVAVPWLPLIAEHITVTLVVQPAPS
jgi:hypothetical protein